jgi:putative transposase
VYGRIARGERVFSLPEEASRFVGVVSDVKRRDGLTVLAWCVTANHYHLAVRTAAAPLWRSIRLIQWRYARDLNRRRRQLGPVWQGRYQVRLVEDQRYLIQLVAYIHLNPVAAGIVDEAAAYRWSGHRELLRTTAAPLVDRGRHAGRVRGHAHGSTACVRAAAARGAGSELDRRAAGRLPWWGRREVDDETAGAWERELATPARERPALARDLGEWLASAASIVGVGVPELGGRGKMTAVVRARELIAVVGVERYGVRVKALGERLGMSAGSVSRCIGRAAARRATDGEFARRCEDLERRLTADSPAL